MDWTKRAIKRPGALRQALGGKKGQDIPMNTLAKAAKAPGRQARLAKTLRNFK